MNTQPASTDAFSASAAAFCHECGSENQPLLRCSACRAVTYCNKTCQQKGWTAGHKASCKHMLYVPFSDLKGLKDKPPTRLPEHPDTDFAKLCLAAASSFYSALSDDLFPSKDAEEFWGIRGDPASPETQRLYTAYQQGCKYGDLTRQKLYEALYSYPRASEALTTLLQNTKMVITDHDDPKIVEAIATRYKQRVKGLVVQSAIDSLPLSDATGTAQAAALYRNGL